MKLNNDDGLSVNVYGKRIFDMLLAIPKRSLVDTIFNENVAKHGSHEQEL